MNLRNATKPIYQRPNLDEWTPATKDDFLGETASCIAFILTCTTEQARALAQKIRSAGLLKQGIKRITNKVLTAANKIDIGLMYGQTEEGVEQYDELHEQNFQRVAKTNAFLHVAISNAYLQYAPSEQAQILADAVHLVCLTQLARQYMAERLQIARQHAFAFDFAIYNASVTAFSGASRTLSETLHKAFRTPVLELTRDKAFREAHNAYMRSIFPAWKPTIIEKL